MKYNIMYDYGSEGFSFHKKENETIPKDFDNVGEAVVAGLDFGYSIDFIVVNVVDYKKLIKSNVLNEKSKEN